MENELIFNSLSKVEYLITFNAFIYGYIISRFFTGWGLLLSNRRTLVFSFEHIMWSLFAFFMILSLWWYSWMDIKEINTSLGRFFISLVNPLLMYMISSLYFPEIVNKQITDLGKDSRFQRKQSAFLYFILYLFNLTLETLDPERGDNTVYFIIGGLVCIVAFFSRKRWLGQLNLAIGFIVICLYMFNVPAYYKTEYWAFEDLSFSEYITIFFTFIYGFIVAKFLDTWSYFVLHRRTIRFNTDYLLWTLLVFGLIVDFWWGLWQMSQNSSKYFGYFIVTLLIPIGFYFLSSVLLSNSKIENSTAQDNFRQNYKLVFGAIAMIFVSNFLGTIIVNKKEIIHPENLFVSGAIILAVIAMIKNNLLLHRMVLALSYLLLLVHILK